MHKTKQTNIQTLLSGHFFCLNFYYPNVFSFFSLFLFFQSKELIEILFYSISIHAFPKKDPLKQPSLRGKLTDCEKSLIVETWSLYAAEKSDILFSVCNISLSAIHQCITLLNLQQCDQTHSKREKQDLKPTLKMRSVRLPVSIKSTRPFFFFHGGLESTFSRKRSNAWSITACLQSNLCP